MTEALRALATFADAVSTASAQLAADLRAASSTAAIEIDTVAPADLEAVIAQLGPRQKEIVRLPGLRDEAGMKASDVARAIDYEQPNTHATLQTLQGRGIVEQVPNASPTRWRLVAAHRGSDPYLAVAALVARGEWTTYGDISIVVRGDTAAARGVGRAAATLDTFPNPHRVLMKGGLIHPDWKTNDGQGREVCRQRLIDDGVDVGDDWEADPAKRVPWDVLRDRARRAGVRLAVDDEAA
jgi:alkylated DNA nucleotide flippase Atl1